MQLPDGKAFQYKPKTVGKWYNLYNRGGMWQADTCYLPYIREDGKFRRVYLIMILDDYSRMIVGGKLYYQENAANFQKTLREAVAAYGLPLQQRPAFLLLHTPVRDGASKGKVERNFRTLKERWLYSLDISQIQRLGEFNRLLADYIRKTQHDQALRHRADPSGALSVHQ